MLIFGKKPDKLKYLQILALFLIVSCSTPSTKVEAPKTNPAYDQAFTLRDSGQADSAYLYFSKAKDLFLAEKDSLGIGKCLLNMAIISTDQGDLFGGQELSLSAIQFFDPAKPTQHIYILSSLNNLGMTNYALKDYDQAISFYKQAEQYTIDTPGQLILQNNIANAYRRKGELKQALAIYEHVLKQKLSPTEYARTLSNFAYTKWLQHSSFNANPTLEAGLKMRTEIGDLQAQIASFDFLTQVNADRHPEIALKYARRMYAAATSIKNANDRLSALQKLISLSDGTAAKRYFQEYYLLNDSIQSVRNAAKNQFALIRYEAEKSKAENLRLQKQNAARVYEVAKRDLLLLLGSLGFFASAIIALLWYRKRRDKMEADKQKALDESRLRTSKRVHDVVANGIYRVMTEIDHQEELDKVAILDKLELMYEKSRDISYEMPNAAPAVAGFYNKINELLHSFATSSVKVSIAGNTAAFWENVPVQTRYELEQILQELMVNMKKHSQATTVSIDFLHTPTSAEISYQDNGIGMNASPKNGLTNTGTRIEIINGRITFGSSAGGGLSIKLFFPTIIN